MKLTQETILATRQHFAALAQACIDEVLSGDVVLPKHTSQESYFAWRREQSAADLAGKNDHTMAFLQYANYFQTGECIALLP